MVGKDAALRRDRSRLWADPALAPFLVRPDLRQPRRAVASGLIPLDAILGGGFPRGRISELVGSRTSGRTRLLLTSLAAATARGALAALVDVADGLDPASAAGVGVDLQRLLWIRCGGRLGLAWPAADALVRGGGFEIVAVDLGDLPPWTLARVALAVLVRLQRAVEGTPTVLLVTGSHGVAGSLAALTVALGRGAPHWATPRPGLLLGIETEVRLVRAHDRVPGKTVRLVWDLEPLVEDRHPDRRPGGGPRAFHSPGARPVRSREAG
jgi:hypothetical protein